MRLAKQKKEEEEKIRAEEAEKKAKEAEEKRKRLEEAEKKRQAMVTAQKEKQEARGMVVEHKVGSAHRCPTTGILVGSSGQDRALSYIEQLHNFCFNCQKCVASKLNPPSPDATGKYGRSQRSNKDESTT